MKETNSSDFISLVSQIPELDTEHAIETIGGSEALYESTVKYMMRFIPSNVEQMDKCLNTDNALNDFAIKVHGIKSSLRQMGHLHLAKQAEALEKAAKAGENSFCIEHYGSFRDDLLCFYNQVNYLILLNADKETGCADESTNHGEISNFYDILTQIKAEAEAYDTISAAEKLLPLTKYRFSEDTNRLIAKAMEALDTYKPRQALEYLAELLDRGF